MTEPDLTQRAAYSFWWKENIRFSDTDMVGHVNNVAFAALLESGRTAFTHADRFVPVPPGLQPVMARIEIDYRSELHWPATVDVGSVLLSIGRRSFVVGNGVFLGERCAATARTVIVMMDRQTRKSAEIPAAYREALERLLPAG